jgi:prepilin-type N-terminal cleavage/methylation domain-containing protein
MVMQSAANERQRGLTLVELLVAMAIMSVVITMLVMVFINLQGAYSFTISSDHAREDAREAMALMVTEIRDAQIPTTGLHAGQPPIIYASSNDIRFYTSYGTPGGTGAPILTRFRYRLDSSTGLWTLFEQRDTNGNDMIDSGDERQTIATDIVNHDPNGDGSQDDRSDMFTYSYYDADANLATTGATYSSTGTVVAGTTSVPPAESINIISVGIRIIADLNPGRAPVYLDLQSTVQPRNLRQ